MKTLATVTMAVLFAAASPAQTPTYNLVLANDALVDSTTYEFDITMLRTGGTALQFAKMEGVMTFNTGISSGSLTLSLINGSSDLNSQQIPTSVSLIGNELRIDSTTPPGPGSGTVIPTSPGLRVGRFRLSSTTAFTAQKANIAWKNSSDPFTSVYAYDLSDAVVNITNSSDHLNSLSNPSLSPPVITSTTPRPASTSGAFYRDTLRARGGTLPLSWAVVSGALPPGITMSSSGIISGTATLTGDYSFTARVTDNISLTDQAAFTMTVTPISVTVTTSPSGRQMTVDGLTYTSPHVFSWTATQSHSISVDSIVAGTSDTRYPFLSWSDGGARTHTVAPGADSTFTAGLSTQYLLTTSAGTGGTAGPASGFFTSGASVQITATAATGYTFAGWAGTGSGSFTGATNPVSITMNGPITEAAAFTANAITFTVTTNPAGRSIIVDAVTYTSPQIFNWTAAQSHTFSVDSVQNGAAGTRYLYASWSNAGTRTQTITPLINGSVTVSFDTQYFLTMTANPGGTVTPPSGWNDAGGAVTITGVPNSGFSFSSWIGAGTGSYTGSTNPRAITMNGPITEIANFVQNPYQVVVQTVPAGRTFRVNSVNYTTLQTFSVSPGTPISVSIPVNPQSGPAGTQYAWATWSDSGTISHSFTPSSDTVVTANFTTQFQLTMNAAAGGSGAPSTGYFDSAQVVAITATPTTGYTFAGWIGSGTGSYSGPLNPSTVTMRAPITETPAFTLTPISVTVRTNPAGRSFTVDGLPYTNSQLFAWSATGSHTLNTTSAQGDSATRYFYSSWSDGGLQSHTVSPIGDSIFTVNFTTQYYLTMDTGTGFGTVSPASGWYAPGASVPISATPDAGYNFAGWVGTGTGSYTGPLSSTTVTMNSPVRETAAWSTGTIPVTVTTAPAGRAITVDGVSYTSPQTFNWTTGSSHAIATDSIQTSGSTGVRYRWLGWNDAGALSHTVSPAVPTTYTAGFRTQYQLTMIANAGGTVTPPTSWYDSLSNVVITGVPNSGYIFSSWSGSGNPGSGFYSGATNPQTIPLGGPVTETANFAQPTVNVTIQTNPPGRTFRVDNGSLQTNTYTFAFGPGTTHTLSADSIQSGATNVRYLWTSWSDGGDRSHTVVYPGRDTTFVVNFKTQFQLTMNAAAGGTSTPSTGYFDSAQVVAITATPNATYSFSGWAGSGTGSYTGPANPSSVTMGSPVTETPSFTLAPINVTVQTNPAGRSFIVDGTTYANSQLFTWSATGSHTLNTTSPQGDTATRYLYASWSDAGLQNHIISPVRDSIFTVNFTTQYYLTMDTGTGFGTVSPANNWYNAGASAPISATPDAGYNFAGWVGTGTSSYTGPLSSTTVTMNSPVRETATWSTGTIPVTVATIPTGLSIKVDGVTYTSPQTFNWGTGSSHAIAADSIQASGSTGVRYRWLGWNDAGALSHTVSPTVPTTYTAGFKTQYQLTMVANPGGTVSPTTSWYDSLAGVVITGIPNAGYTFSSWSGTGNPGSGFYTGTANPRTITLAGPVTETANFAQPTVSVTIQTNPPGRTFRVDNGSLLTNTYTFSYAPADVPHTVTADSLQAPTASSRLAWTSWSDGGARSHTIPYPGKDTTIVVNFRKQFYVTMNAGIGGTILPAGGYFDSSQVVVITATPSGGYSFAGWTGSGPGSYTGPANPGSVTMDSAITEAGAFTLAPVNVTVQTNPAGLQFTVDGTAYTGTQAFVWSATSPHTLSAPSPQGDTATRYVFSTWNDGGTQTHAVSPFSDSVFTVNFGQQYYLTMDTGAGGGALAPASGFFNAGQTVPVSATPRSGYNFGGWTGTGAGSYTGANNPATVTMNSPVKETAAWTAGTIPVTVATSPAGLSITVDSVSYTSPATFSWTTGSAHTISTDSIQASGSAGTRYRWATWNDAGTLSHTVSPTSTTTFTATFGTQYPLTMTANPGGTVTPPSGWYDALSLVTITGVPNNGFSFSSWIGTGAGSYTGSTNPRAITMNAPITEIANFVQNPYQVVVQTVPVGRTFRVNGANYTTLQTFSVSPGTPISLSIPVNPQSGPAGTQYAWAAWSDSGTISHNFTPVSDTVVTANFTTQFLLTMNSGSGGSVLPATGWHDSASAVQVTATPSGGYTFAGWIGSGTGSYSGPLNPATVTMSAPVTETASFTLFPVTVRLRSNPPGRTVLVDTIPYVTPQDIIWTSGTTHTISADSLQVDTAGVRRLYTGWSDGKARTHAVTGLGDTTFTANFRSQYFLTMAAGTGGTVAPPDGWHDSAASVPITATPSTGYVFSGWTGTGTGSYTGPMNPSAVVMGGPVDETASFALDTVSVTVRTNPDGYPVYVDGARYTSPATFSWVATSSHSVSTDSAQLPSGGARLGWISWNDGGARTHDVAPLTDTTFTANLGLQYLLTMVANPGGTVTPPSGWVNNGATVPITAIPNLGFTFASWSGSGTGSYSGLSNPRNIVIGGPVSQTANFNQNSILVTVQTDPPGRTFRVDGTSYTTVNTFSFLPGTSHTFVADSLQPGVEGRRYVWTSWSNGGARSHNFVTPPKDSTVVASFGLQWELVTMANPLAGGTINPPGQTFYNAGDTATVLAVNNKGWAFTSWTGSAASSANPLVVVMDSAKNLTAQFQAAATVIVNSTPPGRTINVDGFVMVAPDTFSWLLGTTHTLATLSMQNGSNATRYLYTGWSDTGALSHQVTVDRDSTFTANFQTQYFLYIGSDSNGTVHPDTGWFNAGAPVIITASPAIGYEFINWQGTGPAAYSGYSNPVTITMNDWAVQLASFGQVLPPPTLAGIPNHATDQPITPRLHWNHYAGADNYIVQVSRDSLFSPEANVVDSAGITDTTIALPVLRNIETYFWRVKARVGPDITSFSERRDFSTVGATIAVTSAGLNWGTGFTYEISWAALNLSGKVNVLLSADAGTVWSVIDSNLSGTSTRYRVALTQTPSNFCIVRVQSAENGQFYGDSRNFAILAGALPLIAPVSATVPFPADATISTYYRLVSYPGVVDTTIALSALIPGSSPKDWRMFSDNGRPADYLNELGGGSHLETGRGYWFIKRNDLFISANMVMPPLDTLNAMYRIRLRSGWNILANPFDRNASWSSVLALNGLPSTTALYGYEGSYQPATLLLPFRGYYFYNSTNLSELKMAYPFGTALPTAAAREADWQVRLEYSSEVNDDPSNFIGVAKAAAQGLDDLESHKPPLFLDQGFLYFKRPDWDRDYPLFNTDFRPSIGDGQTWEFEVSREYGTTGTIKFGGIDSIPAEYEVYLVNGYNSVPYDLRRSPEYAFSSVSTTMPFKLLIGPAEYVKRQVEAEVPAEFGLSQNFPNPFNSTTSISVRLPRESRIRLDVYDVLGRKVTTLADGEYAGGTHTFLWEGIDDRGLPVSTGVYLYRLMEGDRMVQAKKMIIAK